MHTITTTSSLSRPAIRAENTLTARLLRQPASGIAAWRGVRAGALALGLACLVANGAADTAETAVATPAGTGRATPATALHPVGDDELVIPEVFQSHLPTTLEKYGLRLSVHPHLGDWENKDRMRLTTTLRYGLTDNLEVSAGSNLYFSHGHGNIHAFDDYGAADLKLGAKLDLGQHIFSGWETGVGVDYQFVTGHPPAELTDGLRHLRPYVTFSHRLESRPDLRIFVGFRGDQVIKTSVPGQFGKNGFRQSSSGITGGWVLDRANWHYTFEASFDTTRVFTRAEEDLYTVRPGVIWEIPTRRDHQIMSHWVVGASVNDTYGPGGNSVGASFTLRYSSDLKKHFHRRPVNPTP